MTRIYILAFIVFLTVKPSLAQVSSRTTTDFNKGWKFSLKNDSLAAAVNYNDKNWRILDLPHDWSIELPFEEKAPATTQGGALPGGIGWYRKGFTVTAIDKRTMIEFDGVYRNSEVWINGHYLGKRPNGYISFRYDLTPYLHTFPKQNVLSVRVDNSQQPNSRWYTGSGIYRNVRLVTVDKQAAIDPMRSFISTPTIKKNEAVVRIETGFYNSIAGMGVTVYTDIYDAAGKIVSRSSRSSNIAATILNEKHSEELRIPNPVLWSVDKPYLYKAVTSVVRNGKVVDKRAVKIGIRSFRFDPLKGFFLNEKSLKIHGVCNHHDLGALGAAVNTRAIERQLEILKAMGCNAIRTAHNPPAPELLDLCDKMGFLVMVEAFDMWKKKKNKFDYFSDFDQWHKQDLQDMVLRDRNHPSVFMWSIGNEIREQFDSTGISLTKELVDLVKAVDNTRPVTAGLSEWNPAKNFMYRSRALDVVGLNYHHEVYDDFPTHYPGESFLGTENMSALATRGHYDFPSDSVMHWPEKSPQKYVEKGNADYTVSAYDQVAAYWGSTHEETWKIIKRHAFLSGLFVWTGFDYLGEPTPYPWPARSSYFGIIDLAGFPKDVYYMYQSEWTTKPVLHVFPHWNWKSGDTVDIWAYYNKADEVELFLNDRSLGVRKKGDDDLHVMWRVPFTPGTLRAVSRKQGKNVLIKEIKTAGVPAKIELVADRKIINADGKDLAFIKVRILDQFNNLVPDADNEIRFSMDGEGVITATDNGYQASLESFTAPQRKCWKGMALVIVRSSEKKGNITLRATANGLRSANLSLKTTGK